MKCVVLPRTAFVPRHSIPIFDFSIFELYLKYKMGSIVNENNKVVRPWTFFRETNCKKVGFKYDPDAAFAGLPYKEGQKVYVDLKSNKLIGCAVAIEDQRDGRVLVRYVDGHEKSANVARMSHVLSSPRGIIVPDTIWFRRLAKTQVRGGAKVLEIGCSFGFCSPILGQRAMSKPDQPSSSNSAENSPQGNGSTSKGAYLGIDISREAIARCQKDHPYLHFEVADVLSDAVWNDEKLDLASFDTVFLDIGGNREAAPVAEVMKVCHERLPKLGLFVIKCEELANEAEAFMEENGLEADGVTMTRGEKWFEGVIDISPSK